MLSALSGHISTIMDVAGLDKIVNMEADYDTIVDNAKTIVKWTILGVHLGQTSQSWTCLKFGTFVKAPDKNWRLQD